MVRSHIGGLTLRKEKEMKTWFIEVLDWEIVHAHVVWFVLTWAAVLFAMLVDLITGVRKARQAGIATTSRLMKKTCDKAIKYFFPMLCLMPIDIMASVVLPVPAFTMAMAAFNIFCEFKSVMEKTHTKKEMHDAANTMQVVVKNKEDLMQTFAELLEKMKNERKEKEGEQ